jgi:hypothetical protein
MIISHFTNSDKIELISTINKIVNHKMDNKLTINLQLSSFFIKECKFYIEK